MSKLYPLILVILCFSCQKTSTDFISSGIWGGEHARLSVAEGSWYVEFDCAHLEVGQRVSLNKGRFDSEALYTQEYGVFFEDQSLYIPKKARVYGRIDGYEMTLHVEVEGQSFGTFTLIRGVEPLLYKCA